MKFKYYVAALIIVALLGGWYLYLEHEPKTTAEERAIKLAKGATSISENNVLGLYNELAIESILENISGPYDFLGWRARNHRRNVYIVSCQAQSTRTGRIASWDFEVEMEMGLVRFINEDSVLRAYYDANP